MGFILHCTIKLSDTFKPAGHTEFLVHLPYPVGYFTDYSAWWQVLIVQHYQNLPWVRALHFISLYYNKHQVLLTTLK